MAQVRIRPVDTTRVVAEFRADVDPHDSTACLALLRRTCARQRLGDPADFRLEAWDQRRGWIEHRP